MRKWRFTQATVGVAVPIVLSNLAIQAATGNQHLIDGGA
jgi:hypothetical protein